MTDLPTDVHVDSIEGTGTVTLSSPGDHAVNDTLTVRLVVVALAIIVATCVICVTTLSLAGVMLPEGVVVGLLGLASTSTGALGAMLASTASKRT